MPAGFHYQGFFLMEAEMEKTKWSARSVVLVAFASAGMFGFGPIAVKHLHSIADLSTFSASVKATTFYFLCVYFVVVLFSFLKRVTGFSVFRFWNKQPLRTKSFQFAAALSNAVSGWCFFTMLGLLDPLSGSLLMALAVVFNFLCAKVVLGENVSFRSRVGKTKWMSFALIIAGVLTVNLYSYFMSNENSKATLGILVVAFLSSLFSSIRRICVKRVLNDYKTIFPHQDSVFGIPLAVTRASYLIAFLISFLAGVVFCLMNADLPLVFENIVFLHPFILVLGLIYGAAYSLNYIAMNRIEASIMVLVTSSCSVFTAFYMLIGAGVFQFGTFPSWIQAPAAVMVITGSYFAAKADTKKPGD